MGKPQVADDASVSRQPPPRGARADGLPAPEGITTIGQDVVVKGEVKGGEDLVVDGKVDGTIELPEHTLTVGSTGRVTAQLSAKSVVVLGKVKGNIRASERVSIGETGLVEGAVSAPRVLMADGAQLQGRVDMSRRSSTSGGGAPPTSTRLSAADVSPAGPAPGSSRR